MLIEITDRGAAIDQDADVEEALPGALVGADYLVRSAYRY